MGLPTRESRAKKEGIQSDSLQLDPTTTTIEILSKAKIGRIFYACYLSVGNLSPQTFVKIGTNFGSWKREHVDSLSLIVEICLE